MALRHVGIRPTHSLELLDFKRKIYIEVFEDESYKLWTERMLRSGCDKIMNSTKAVLGCFYCSTCDEYFSEDQWEISHERRGKTSNRQISER